MYLVQHTPSPHINPSTSAPSIYSPLLFGIGNYKCIAVPEVILHFSSGSVPGWPWRHSHMHDLIRLINEVADLLYTQLEYFYNHLLP